MSGRTLAIGDIHGTHIALGEMLRQLQLTAEDTLVILGDVVDRGPGSKQAIDLLIHTAQECALIFIRGNHEEMMLDAINGGSLGKMWLQVGGREALESYGGGVGMIPASHIEFLESSIDIWETETELFIHANLEPEVELKDQHASWIRWRHLTGWEQPHPSGKRIICGHTSQPSGEPFLLPGWVCIDTFAHGRGYLTCLDVEANLIYQTNQRGDFLECVSLDVFET